MKTYLVIFLMLILVGCENTTVEPIEPINYSGVWEGTAKNIVLPLTLFLRQDGDGFTADIFCNQAYIGTVDNGKIIGDEKYVSFSFKQVTGFGDASMGFNGRFYGEELRGVVSGRVFLMFGNLGVFNNELYTFKKQNLEY